MFKKLFKVRIGAWGLQAGVYLKWQRPLFLYQHFWWDQHSYYFKVLWLEFSAIEFPP
jgi:hypothetical protein